MRAAAPRLVQAAAIVGAGVLAGCTTSGAPDARVDTPALVKDLQASLARDENLARVTSVAVDPKTGVVTLSGRVESPEERANAGRLACSVKGVKVVYNVIQIQARAR